MKYTDGAVVQKQQEQQACSTFMSLMEQSTHSERSLVMAPTAASISGAREEHEKDRE